MVEVEGKFNVIPCTFEFWTFSSRSCSNHFPAIYVIHVYRTNHHPGNKRYRKLVEARKVDYVNSKRLDKPLVALDIIKMWRSQKPPGRFLKIDEDSGLWHDVGDKKAREKTSQALREKAPLLRKQQEEQRKEREVSVKVTTTTKEKLKVCRRIVCAATFIYEIIFFLTFELCFFPLWNECRLLALTFLWRTPPKPTKTSSEFC